MHSMGLALKFAIGRGKARGAEEVSSEDLLVGGLVAISRFGVVSLGDWIIDLEELGVDWAAGAPRGGGKLAYSDEVVAILDRAAVLSKAEGAGRIGVEHVLVCFAQETSGVMGTLRTRYGVDSVRWRAAVGRIGGGVEVEPEPEIARAVSTDRAYLSPEEAAEFLGVHVQTLRGYIRSGKLPALRVAGERVIRIHRSSLENLLEPFKEK